MNALETARHRRHLQHLADAAAELDSNVTLAIRQLAKDDHDGTKDTRKRLAETRIALTQVGGGLEEALAVLPGRTLRVVA